MALGRLAVGALLLSAQPSVLVPASTSPSSRCPSTGDYTPLLTDRKTSRVGMAHSPQSHAVGCHGQVTRWGEQKAKVRLDQTRALSLSLRLTLLIVSILLRKKYQLLPFLAAPASWLAALMRR